MFLDVCRVISVYGRNTTLSSALHYRFNSHWRKCVYFCTEENGTDAVWYLYCEPPSMFHWIHLARVYCPKTRCSRDHLVHLPLTSKVVMSTVRYQDIGNLFEKVRFTDHFDLCSHEQHTQLSNTFIALVETSNREHGIPSDSNHDKLRNRTTRSR